MNPTLSETIAVNVAMYRVHLRESRRLEAQYGTTNWSAAVAYGRAMGIASVLRDLTSARSSYPAHLHQFRTISLLRAAA